MALYIIWLFCWDDAIDQQGSDDLSNDLLRAKTRHDNTMIVLEHVLGLGLNDGSCIQYDHANTELKAIGAQLRKAYTHGKSLCQLWTTNSSGANPEQKSRDRRS